MTGPKEGESREGARREPRSLEIERRFLVASLPDDIRTQIRNLPYTDITQGYSGFRLRRSVTSKGEVTYIMGIKTSQSADPRISIKHEEEWPIDEARFRELWPSVDEGIIEKRRYRISHGEHTIQLDIFRGGEIDGRMLAEVEFNSVDEAQAFRPPEWFGSDVTSVVSNAKLARKKTSALLLVQGSAVFTN
jgi:adenylate cyclase